MKQHINLLHKNKKYQEKEQLFKTLRLISIIIGLLSFALVFLMYFVNAQADDLYKKLLGRKELYLRQLIQTKDSQNKIAYVNDTSSYLQDTVKKDLNFSPYYSIIQQYLLNPLNNDASQAALLEQLNFDNKQTIEFKIRLNSDESLTAFLQALENDQFSGYFKSIQLTDFTTVGNNLYYEATVKGIYKPFKDSMF